MARWQELEEAAPELAARIRAAFDARVHKAIATPRADGSPRISGIEASFRDGDLWFGSMADARKALDLRRDPRFALHSGTADPPDWDPDAKVSGVADEVEPNRFRADIHEAVLIGLNDERNRLVIELWRPGCAVERVER
jgi:Pyridoxamine 5'-phosphate oxidase